FVAGCYAAGPNEPTLVDQWQTQHLAASVYLRENPHQVTARVSGTSTAAMNTAIEKLAEESSSRKAFYSLVRKIGDGAEPAPSGKRPSLFKRVRNSMKQRRHAADSLLLEIFFHTKYIHHDKSRLTSRIHS